MPVAVFTVIATLIALVIPNKQAKINWLASAGCFMVWGLIVYVVIKCILGG